MADRMEKYYKKLIKNYFTRIPIAASNVSKSACIQNQLRLGTRLGTSK